MVEFNPRFYILGVGISAINMSQALTVVDDWIENNNQQYVCVAPVHAIMDYHNNPTLIKIANQSGLTTPDGMPVAWLLKLAGYKHASRVYGPDLMQAVCEHGRAKSYRHFLYGATSDALIHLSNRIQKRFPGLIIAGTYSPPFRELTEVEDSAICQSISNSKPDILWVGLGSPKQELWMYEHQGKIDVPVMIGVGAAFDFLSGNKPQAPRWIQRLGMEWLFRLLSEPRRLWKRYLLGYPKFVYLLIKHHVFKVPLDA